MWEGSHGQALSSNSDHQTGPAPEVLLFCVPQSNVPESELSLPLSSIMRSLARCLGLSWVMMLSLAHNRAEAASYACRWVARPCDPAVVHSFMDSACARSTLRPRQWCTAVKTKLILLTDRQSSVEHQIRQVQVSWQWWALRNMKQQNGRVAVRPSLTALSHD